MTETLTADDRLTIREMLTRWAMYEDRGDSGAWANLFTPDGQCTYSSGRTVTGHAALIAASQERWAKPASRRTIHWMGDPVITPVQDGAHVVHYCMIITKPEENFEIQTLSERSYQFVRHDGEWRIKHRTYASLPLEGRPKAQESPSTVRHA